LLFDRQNTGLGMIQIYATGGLSLRVDAIHQTRHTAIQKLLETTIPPPLQISQHPDPKLQKANIQSPALAPSQQNASKSLKTGGDTAAYCFRLPRVTGPG
jgi:hypothetical protein